MITIPLWGKMGAAMASVVSYAVAGFVFLGYYLKTYQIPLSAVFCIQSERKGKNEEQAACRAPQTWQKSKLILAKYQRGSTPERELPWMKSSWQRVAPPIR